HAAISRPPRARASRGGCVPSYTRPGVLRDYERRVGGSGCREMRPQLLARYGGRLGVDQDEGENAGCGSVIDPGVHRAALNDDIAGLQMRHLAAVEFEIAFAR